MKGNFSSPPCHWKSPARSGARPHFHIHQKLLLPVAIYRLSKHTLFTARQRSESFVFALHSPADASASVLAPASSRLYMAQHAAGCAGALLPQQKVSLLLLLLLVSLSQHVQVCAHCTCRSIASTAALSMHASSHTCLSRLSPQAQVRSAAVAPDTSWMPATTATTGTKLQPASAAPAVAGGTATTRTAQPGTAGSIELPLRPAAAAGTPSAATGTTAAVKPSTQPPYTAPTMGGAATATAAGTATGPSSKSGMPKASSAAANPAGSLHNVLAKNAPLFRSLLAVLAISPEQVPDSTVGTIFAPTDEVSGARQGRR